MLLICGALGVVGAQQAGAFSVGDQVVVGDFALGETACITAINADGTVQVDYQGAAHACVVGSLAAFAAVFCYTVFPCPALDTGKQYNRLYCFPVFPPGHLNLSRDAFGPFFRTAVGADGMTSDEQLGIDDISQSLSHLVRDCRTGQPAEGAASPITVES
eukprot:SAG31_NODE_14537_length_800_cov_2.496434_1_plen_159_part_10